MISFFLPGISRGQAPIFICDNGGFEDGFTNYTGEWASWYYGSDNCTPMFTTATNPPVDIPAQWTTLGSLGDFRRFEIVNVGNDQATGFKMVKKGNHSLKLNNLLSHITTNNSCRTDYDLNKIVKQFEVDPENRIFTVWYSVVFENAPNHTANELPYFSIKCDLAPNSGVCFDEANLGVASIPYSHTCISGEDGVKATNWVCHTIIIPEEEVGNIATLEIVAGDCGCDYHFGYAYIDAICEPCDSSSFGGGKFLDLNYGLGIEKTCNGDTIKLCGTYYLPSISGTYTLDSFVIPGVTAYSKEINSTEKTFCFKIEKSDFEDPLCKDIYAILYFSSSAGQLPPVISKPHTICYGDFVVPELDIEVGQCNRNNPSDNYISDDYYYVTVDISQASYVPWVLTRQLGDYYTDESGNYELLTGVGDGTHVLGPFLIQEGRWTLILDYNNCSDTFQIAPPDFCSTCAELSKIKISNIICTGNDQWTYDIKVSYNGAQSTDYFKIGTGTTQYLLNQTHTIISGTIGTVCREVLIKLYLNEIFQCDAIINICPPQKCNNVECDIEVNIKNIICDDNGSEYYLDLDVSNATCFSFKYSGGGYSAGESISNPIGPFTEDMNIRFYSCSSPTSCTCSIPTCVKQLFVHMPDDCPRDFGNGSESTSLSSSLGLEIYPNPLIANELIINSSGKDIEYSIFSTNGILIYSGILVEKQTKLNLNISSGIYFLQYLDSKNNFKVLKLVKF